MRFCWRRRDPGGDGLDALASQIEGIGARLDRWNDGIHKERERERLRSTWTAAAALIIGAVTLASSWFLFGSAQASVPVADDPGRIAVASLDTGSQAPPVDIVVSFDANTPDRTAFTLAISRTTAEGVASPPSTYALFFCGRLMRSGLHVKEVNGGEGLLLKPASEASAVDFDSRLGDRKQCRYAIVQVAGFQLLLEGASDSPMAYRSVARVLFALPGLVTTVTRERLEDKLWVPLPPPTTLNVVLSGAPSDLRVEAASPQVPPSGQLAWTSAPTAQSSPPTQYRLTGSLASEENAAQSRIFVAGALVGVAGAALLWSAEMQLLGYRRRGSQA